MSFLGKIGKWFWNGTKALPSALGFDMSAFENDEAQNFEAQQAALGRQWQEEMLQKQMDYQTEMWHKTNEYNSAKSQMDRYREAGLNPYLMMTGGASAGVASSQGSPSAPGTSTPSGHSGTNYTPAGQLVKNLAGAKVDAQQERLVSAESSIKEAQADVESLRLIKMLRTMDLDIDQKRKINYFTDDLLSSVHRKLNSEDMAIHTQMRMQIANAIYQELVNEKFPEDFKASLALKLSQVQLNNSMSSTEGYKQWNIMQDVIESQAREFGVHLDNKEKQAIFDAVVYDAYHGFTTSWQAASRFAQHGKYALDGIVDSFYKLIGK